MKRIGLLPEFYGIAGIALRRKCLRITRAISVARRLPISGGFFDEYPEFYSTSHTSAVPNRLNQRYKACIEWNLIAIKGKRILDIASHDGRWSFAAINAGAAHVKGIEARDRLVEASRSNLRRYGVPEQSFQFIAGDVFEAIDDIEPNSIDTVFCFGFLYHAVNHMLLLSKIEKLKPKHLILDTAIFLDPNPVIGIKAEDPEIDGSAVRFGSDAAKRVIVGWPSRAALELMLSNFGWTFTYYDWHSAGIRRWDKLDDYHEGSRVTLRVVCMS
jgi:precorrin-6B methylase 2